MQERYNMNWLIENAGTIIVSLLLTGVVCLAVRQMRRDKKQGKSTCGGNCGCCPMGSKCHKPS